MAFNIIIKRMRSCLLERRIGFEEIIHAIVGGNLLDIRKHHNQERYPNHKILYVRILDEVYAVLFIEEVDGSIFLKTLFASRKARKAFLRAKLDR